ncbi:hypothetical protein J8L85_03680 [Maribacter sp. MMG018]|uniref:hypothetical protein n=1 Tax=Maribacter sp. MMG018 TaxID=2822688 RepID=UPI001B36EA2A|nr:hypothetical protein [Maribacter sp. MMG018]MBQ4913522.1 hypothetical protein [Maribacter sp. MMG018]
MRISIIIFFMSIIFGCKENTAQKINTKTRPVQQPMVQDCMDKKDREKIIEAIVSTPDFQMFLHPKIEGRLPVKLVKNEFVTSDLIIYSNGLKVQFVDSLELPEGSQHRITIGDIDCSGSKISYSVYYPIEGAIISGKVYKNHKEWVATETTWGEI